MKILGLDLGTNSIGWALLEYEEDQLKDIIGAGSRIIPLDSDLRTSFEKGQTMSQTAGRRQKRSARRLNQRFKQRRAKLLLTFVEMGLLDRVPDLNQEPQQLDLELVGKPQKALELYQLRAQAVSRPVTLSELARVLLHLNQRRGYRPTRSEKRQLARKEDVRYGYFSIQNAVATGDHRKGKAEFGITLSDGTQGIAVGSEWEEMVGKEFPMEIKTTKSKKGEISTELKLIDTSDDSWASRLGAMESELAFTGLTPGQFFHQKLQVAEEQGNEYRIRQKLIYRKRYVEEFDRIWTEQCKHHPELKDQQLLARIVEKVCPKHYPQKQVWKKKDLGTFIRDFIIYYQRPLKSQKGSIALCTFESDFKKRVIPKSHPLFQEFKIWNQVNNLRIQYDDGTSEVPSPVAREELYRQLSKRTRLTATQVAKICGCKSKDLSIDKELEGNTTAAQLRSAAEDAGLDWGALSTQMEPLWHILYSLDQEEDEVVLKALETQCGIAPAIAEPFLNVYFAKDYGSLSSRAIHKLLPFMRLGEFWSDSDLGPWEEQIEAIVNGVDHPHLAPAIRRRLAKADSRNDFSGLQYWEAATLVYGSHAAQQTEEQFTSWQEIESLPQYSLRNPVVEQVINEAMQVVRAVWKQHGKPDRIHLEMAREMRQNAKQRARATRDNRDRAKDREKIAKILQEEFSIAKPSRKDIQRYQLWREAGKRCLYSNKPIPCSALFSQEVDIDHIIPQSRFFDDSYLNKVVTFRTINRDEKKNKIPSEFIRGTEWEAFKERITQHKELSPTKKRLLLAEEVPEGFVSRQLQNTSYISRRIRTELERVCPPVLQEDGSRSPRVMLTSGTITSYLRGIWKLNGEFKQALIPRYERLEALCEQELITSKKGEVMLKGFNKRIDHRHHALDALVVAATRQRYIQILNELNQEYSPDETSKQGRRKIPLLPLQLRRRIGQVLREMIVSHKSRWRLASPHRSWVQFRDATGKLRQKQSGKPGWSIHGPLHKETVYGKAKQYIKIPVKKAFQRPEDIVVDWQRERIETRLEQHGGDPKKALRSLKKFPLADLKEEELTEVTVMEEVTTQVVALASLSHPQLESKQALDRKLGDELLEHARKFPRKGGKLDAATAFSGAGLIAFNAGRNKPVFKVKLIVGAKPVALDHEADNPRLVNPGDNFGVGVEIDPEGKRSTTIVSFMEAAHLVMLGQAIFQPQPGKTGFFLRKGETVYVLRPDEALGNIDWNDKEAISERIYICRKMSGKQFYFLPHTVAVPLKKKDGFSDNEFGSSDLTEFHGIGENRQKIIQFCIKVKVDHLGNVSPLK